MVVVKVSLGDDIRRFSLTSLPSFVELRGMLERLFSTSLHGVYDVKYLDSESDQITVTSDAELVDAFGMAHTVGDNKLVRLYLVPKGTNPSLLASVVPSAPSQQKTVDVDLTSLLSSFASASGSGAQNGGSNPIVTLLSNLLAASTSGQQQQQQQQQQACPWLNARNEDGARVHMYYVCDGCEATPVVGNLHQCDVCPDYHLCESCRNAGVHMDKNHTFTVNPPRRMPASHRHHGHFPPTGRRGQNCCSPANSPAAAAKPVAPVVPVVPVSPAPASPQVPSSITSSNPISSIDSTSPGAGALPFLPVSPAEAPVKHCMLPIKPPVPVVNVPVMTPVKPIGIVETTNKSPLVPQVQVVPTERLEMVFLSDVTIPDGTEVNVGETFNKVWRLSNSGHTTWPLGCHLSLESNTGERLSSVEKIEIPGEVPPGSAVTISVEMEAPKKAGRHVSYWRMHGPSGQAFGNRIWVDIISNEKAPAPVVAQPTAPAVAPISSSEVYATQLEALYRMGFLNIDLNRNLLENAKGNLSAVIDELVSRQF